MPIQDALDAVLERRGLRTPRRDSLVFQAWREALGATRARSARPARFRDGELVVEVSSPSLHHELRCYAGDGLRRQANELLGGERIRRVTYKVAAPR